MSYPTAAITLTRLIVLMTLLLTNLSIAIAEPMPESEISLLYTDRHIASVVHADGSYAGSVYA